MCYLHQASGQKDCPKEESRSGRLYESTKDRDKICGPLLLAVLWLFWYVKSTLIAIRGTRGSLFQKKTDETADVKYNLVALDCRDEE